MIVLLLALGGAAALTPSPPRSSRRQSARSPPAAPSASSQGNRLSARPPLAASSRAEPEALASSDAAASFVAAAADLDLASCEIVIQRPPTDPGVQKVMGRLVELKKEKALQLSYKRKGKCDIQRNHYAIEKKAVEKEEASFAAAGLDASAALAHVLRGAASARARLQFANGTNVALELLNGTLQRTVTTTSENPVLASHDRAKNRALDPAQENSWLALLGVTDEAGKTLRGREKKMQQIFRYAELLQHAAAKVKFEGKIRVLDCGSGRGYLTFAAHRALQLRFGDNVETVGVEARPELVAEANEHVKKADIAGLSFRCARIEDYDGDVDVLIALHACDTATDDALYTAVRQNAKLVLAAPCCHREVRPQISKHAKLKSSPASLRELARHGILAERHAEATTDALRALLLEVAGFGEAKIFEFADFEHTPRNTMLTATRGATTPAKTEALRQRVAAFASQNGIGKQRLAALLGVPLTSLKEEGGGEKMPPIRRPPPKKALRDAAAS